MNKSEKETVQNGDKSKIDDKIHRQFDLNNEKDSEESKVDFTNETQDFETLSNTDSEFTEISEIGAAKEVKEMKILTKLKLNYWFKESNKKIENTLVAVKSLTQNISDFLQNEAKNSSKYRVYKVRFYSVFTLNFLTTYNIDYNKITGK